MGGLSRLGRAAAVVLAAGTGLPACAADAESVLETIALPDGFAIEIYARVPGARSMAVASDLNVDAHAWLFYYSAKRERCPLFVAASFERRLRVGRRLKGEVSWGMLAVMATGTCKTAHATNPI